MYTKNKLMLLTLVLVAGCSGSTGETQTAGESDDTGTVETVEIGSLLSETGALASLGDSFRLAANLAVDEINAAGGVLGRTLVLTNADDRTEAGGGVDAASDLNAAGITAVIGALGSSWTIEAAEVARDGMVLVSPSSTSPEITTLDDNGYVFRTCPSDSLQGRLMAQRALAAGHGSAAVVHVGNTYGDGMAASFETAFASEGGTLTSKTAYVDGQSSYVDMLTMTLADSPDALVLVAYPADGAQIINDYNATFPEQDVTFYFADALANDEFIALVGADNFAFTHEGTAPSSEGPNYDAFAAAYELAEGEAPGIFQANTYDAVYLVALAIEAAGTTDATLVRDALVEVASGGTSYGPSEYAEMVAAIQRGEDVDYRGASGEQNFDSAGDVVAPYAIWEVASGAVSILATAAPE